MAWLVYEFVLVGVFRAYIMFRDDASIAPCNVTKFLKLKDG